MYFTKNRKSNKILVTRIIFSDEELESAMNDLSINSAAGPDGFPAILLKKYRRVFAPPLAGIWRKSLIERSVPLNCKSAYITLIHKGRSRALPKNYRPVALTSNLVKVFDKGDPHTLSVVHGVPSAFQLKSAWI